MKRFRFASWSGTPAFTGRHYEKSEITANHWVIREPGPKIGPYINHIKAIIEADKEVHKKQRHTAKRIWEILQSEGFTGGYTIVKDTVRQIKKTSLLLHRPYHPNKRTNISSESPKGLLLSPTLITTPVRHLVHQRCSTRPLLDNYWTPI